MLTLKKNKAYSLDVSTMDTECIQDVSVGKDRLGKDRLGKDRLGKDRIAKEREGKSNKETDKRFFDSEELNKTFS